MKKRGAIDLAILLMCPLFATLISLLFKTSAFVSVLLFFGIPALYLSLRGAKYVKKSIVFAAVTSIPLIIILDYVGHLTKAWVIPNSILPFRLFGIVTIEVMLWALLYSYFVLMFYEYFLDKDVTKKIWLPHMKYLVAIMLVLFAAFMILFFNAPSLLHIPYFYLAFGIVLLLIPVIIELFEYPKLISKFARVGAYFFFLTFLYEVTALKLGWWAFPGTEFVGWVSIFGTMFPVEELVFWLILLAIAILSYYEFFDDDEK